MAVVRVVVGSTNPIKIETARLAFAAVFPEHEFEMIGVSVESGVADQPMSNDETLQGATNRADAAMAAEPEADYWVGIEGGAEKIGTQLGAYAWIVVRNRERSSMGRSAEFILPRAITQLMEEGNELGVATDIAFNEQGSKQKAGAIGLLTNNLVTRTDFYTQAMILALIPFSKPTLYT